MKRDVRFSQAAFRHVDAADSWWRENRPAAPDLFLSELRRALSVVQGAPDSFAVLDEPRMHGLRRILLEKSRYHLYWTTTDDTIEILAIWHTSRGHGPLDESKFDTDD
jgi:plasmid stabilization system protein ParE